VSDTLGLIVGSGFDRLGFSVIDRLTMVTPYGPPSDALLRVAVGGAEVWCLPRHGQRHHLPPHAVNYRANIWALREAGVTRCVALNWVGTIDPRFEPGTLALPAQLIDYTTGRNGTFFDGLNGRVEHADFTSPFSGKVRAQLLSAAASAGVALLDGGIYGVTQGPRLETAAEVDRLERDGCTMVGMTAMPEAVLARELELAYGLCALGVNHAAGRSPTDAPIHDQLEGFFAQGLEQLRALLAALAKAERDRRP
jgi:5'-methylthioinosine phosphorylase